MQLDEAYSIFGFEDKIPTEKEIKTAYRELSKKYHPDKKGGSKYWQQLLNRAYERIKNKDKTPPNSKNNLVQQRLNDIINHAFSEDFKDFESNCSYNTKDIYMKHCHNQLELTEKEISNNKKILRKLKKFKKASLKKYKKEFGLFPILNNDIKTCINIIRVGNKTIRILKECETIIKSNIIYEPKKQGYSNEDMIQLQQQGITDSLSYCINSHNPFSGLGGKWGL